MIRIAICAAATLVAAEMVWGGSLKAVATTPFVGDAVRQVAGDLIQLNTLVPPEVDPHAFDPSPADAARLADADVVFVSGAGLEDAFLPAVLKRSRSDARIVDVSKGIAIRTFYEGEADPHVWFNPQNMKFWAANIEAALKTLDPDHAGAYGAGASAYAARLDEIDRWAEEQLHAVAPGQRKLVTDHDSFGYFAERYGYEIVGAVIPGFSTGAEPSARELARLEDDIKAQGVKAVFVGQSVNPAIARRVARDTGAQLVTLNTCSVPAGTGYFQFFKELVEKIAGALK